MLVYQCLTEILGTLLFQSWLSSHFLLSLVHTPALGCPHYSDMSLWRGLNWDTNLSNTHESVSSPVPPMTKVLLQSCIPGSPLETHVSQEILGIFYRWNSGGHPSVSQRPHTCMNPSSRYKRDSPWGPSWTKLAVSITYNKFSLNFHAIKSIRWKKF